MDLMRTLLIYMSATLTLAVQSTSAPKETPTPSPVPEAIVETVETPGPDDGFTAAPAEATEKPTPLPVPTITPNMKAYHNLTTGDKGKEVKKLQEKLIEMGYLPEGAADGAYGRQTYNAVKKFQYYNGLKADGIAGRSTQTNLFENPDIVPNPEVTPVPETTPAPETEAPETEAPETETPVTEAPVTEAPETQAPETEQPKETEAPEPTGTPEVTETPKETETPRETEAPEPTEEPEQTAVPTEIVENVDLDADVYEPIAAMVALNESKGPLEFIATVDGVPVNSRPRLTQNGAKIRVSLDDLCQCVDGWRLTDDGVGSVVLEAAGYTLVLYSEDKGCSATLDSAEIPMKEDDYDFESEGHFINAEFLANALKGEAAWDQEESTLMLRIYDRNAEGSAD